MSVKIEVESGEKFGRLTIIKEVEKHKGRRTFLCKCDCGNESNVILKRLRSGHSKSCGCTRYKSMKQSITKHNSWRTPTYNSWLNMKTRCMNPNRKQYKDYGGRGITIFSEWIDSFQKFYDYMGERPLGTTLDRIDFNGNYEPGNVRWVDMKVQANNRRPRSKKI